MTYDFKWWPFRYGISYRDLEEMLEERGIRSEVRLVERACGIGPEIMSELMSPHRAELAQIAIQQGS
ncbi:MAG: hypothetical protein OXC26_00505 [Albidovulum sp.]|nr:hypothetical protein [Albidovulum sp.]